jgi:4-hydroxybenzoate polyprenyltransferase/phosphoserine phosphatase
LNDIAIPLCVDLDGTLTPVDTLHESILSLRARGPATLLRLPLWLSRGKAGFKREVAAHASIDIAQLPFRAELLEWLNAERTAGRRLVLVTAADRSIAEAVANHLGFFSEVIASDGISNLAGEGKRRALLDRFGEKGFDYVGNEAKDEAVWKSSRLAIVVGSAALVDRARRVCEVIKVFPVEKPGIRVWARALRLHQWVKNILIFLPVVSGHRFFDPVVLSAGVRAFVAFGLCASSVYIVNDLLDLDADRNHPRKRTRPFAAGLLSASKGLVLAMFLLAGAIGLAITINWYFVGVLAGYYVLTWAYSVRLKRAALVDVMTLAALYTVRIIAGAAATLIAPSFWLLAFSMFIFISLGCVKRYTELNDAKPASMTVKQRGRGYWKSDLPLLLSLGTSSGFCTVLVMALYLNSPESQALYRHSKPLWLLCPLILYWISRVWLLTTRGQMHDDPVVFALRDRISMMVLVLAGITFLAAI